MFGNKMINRFFAAIYRVQLHDILSGYRAFTTEGIRMLDLSMPGFEIESEMTIESVKKGLRIIEVPITYQPRSAGTKTKLHPFRDGLKIILTIFRMAKTENPMFYFGLMGSFVGLLGFLVGVYVARDWLLWRIEHVPLTILTAILDGDSDHSRHPIVHDRHAGRYDGLHAPGDDERAVPEKKIRRSAKSSY